jgi:hypothetical protein
MVLESPALRRNMARKANSHVLNREVVLQTAASLVDSVGLEQITMAEIAQSLEI